MCLAGLLCWLLLSERTSEVSPVIVKTVLHTHHCWFGGSCGCGWSLDVVGMGLVGMLEVLTDKKSQFKWIVHAKVRGGVQI